ncbi:hypothetical protein BN1723_017689 [Verticillium longisporum]|uniref:Uncharacterized protein n=1 Tax=Verticillium longisporum TaxID=100787 RepID=A0A0G4L9I4_VERLO|nr:hypothetical protein BN1723_017689 [Verticillium longisporum]
MRFNTLAGAALAATSAWPRLNYTKCVNGYAEAIKGDPLHKFKCKNIDLYDFINHSELGSPNSDASFRTGSSAWGWTDPESGREFVTSGMYDGAAFLEVLPEGRLLHLGFLPSYAPTGPRSLWKEIRSYKNYMLIGSELEGHGIQIFDMRKLLAIKAADAPVRFSNDKDLTGHFADLPVGRSHNVVINEEANYGVAVGAAPRNGTCKAGLIFFDLTDPSKPTRLGCNGEDGYVHDAHCLIYRGPHKKYEGRDICYGYNEDTVTIYDVTDKANSKIISITSYEGATYTHQGWVLDVNNQEYLFLDDEIDEEESAGPAADGYPVTYIFDIRDLEHPKQTGLYKAAVRGIDHNQYIRDGLNFQSNYGAGVRVYDVSSVPEDPTGDSVCEVAFLDIYPEDDNEPGGGIVQYSGTWASYAQFDSGYIFINTIERGAFLAKLTKRERCKPKSCNADNCLRALRSSSVKGRLEESQEFCAGFLDGWNAQVTAVPEYAQKACPTNVISRISSACSCLPTAAPTTA